MIDISTANDILTGERKWVGIKGDLFPIECPSVVDVPIWMEVGLRQSDWVNLKWQKRTNKNSGILVLIMPRADASNRVNCRQLRIPVRWHRDLSRIAPNSCGISHPIRVSGLCGPWRT